MASKRFSNESDDDTQNRPKMMKRRPPSLSSVIGEVSKVNSLQKLCSALEPMLRRVVNEEVEHGLQRYTTRSLSRSSSMRIQTLEPPPSTLKLIFSNKLFLPIFTATKILDSKAEPFGILLVGTDGNRVSLPSPIKVEIVVLYGDFPRGGCERWDSDEFEKNIVKERVGKRPLLAGELQVTLRDGFAMIGGIEFTDNSSWIRSRRFRLGARVAVQGSGGHGVIRIREAMTESFIVRDHRGELYKKHHPPMLNDEVWRLEKIGKDGAYHRKLHSKGIKTVQDLLKLSVVDPVMLRNILRDGKSEKMLDATLKHAKTCVMGNKLYISRGNDVTLILNPICIVVKAVIMGQIFSTPDIMNKNGTLIQNLVRNAYENWDSLEEIEGSLNETALLGQGEFVDQFPNQPQAIVWPIQQRVFLTDTSSTPETNAIVVQEEGNDWGVVNSANTYSSVDNGAIIHDYFLPPPGI